jgi:hypothetical protein
MRDASWTSNPEWLDERKQRGAPRIPELER